MRRLVMWLIIVGVVGLVGYSAIEASRAQRPALPTAPAPAPSPCQVVSYDISPGGSAVLAVVMCVSGGRYQVSAEGMADGSKASGQAVVRLLPQAPTAISIPLSPRLPPDATTYTVRFRVMGM
ncbi:MAG: hypothetical protein ACK4K2_09180 [Dehalococcoidia bacterium]